MKKLIIILLLGQTIYAGGIFSIGHKNFGFSIGSSSGYGNTYTVVGVNANYFVAEGFSVGLGYQGWFGDDPKINEISIPLTYYIPLDGSFSPYVGAIYRHTFIDEPYEDLNVYGARVGVALHTGSNSFMSIGWVQEYYDNTSGGDDSRGYPEISAGFSF